MEFTDSRIELQARHDSRWWSAGVYDDYTAASLARGRLIAGLIAEGRVLGHDEARDAMMNTRVVRTGTAVEVLEEG